MRHRPIAGFVATIAACAVVYGLTMSGCTERLSTWTTAPQGTLIKDIPLYPHDALDILLVVDQAPPISAKRRALSESLPALIDRLQTRYGERLSLRVGVTTTQAFADGITSPLAGCSAEAMPYPYGQLSPRAETCGVTGRYLVNRLEDERAANYDGPFTEALACLLRADQGEEDDQGCRRGQAFSAMRAVFSSGLQDDFLREDAMLAVIFVADEDDCSFQRALVPDDVTNNAFCFTEGVHCAEAPEDGIVGQYGGCIAKEQSDLLASIASHVAYLRGLKRIPTDVMVATVTGGSDQSNNVISIDDGSDDHGGPPSEPRLVATCNAPGDGFTWEGRPAFRFGAFARAFPGRHHQSDVCSLPDPTSLAELGDYLAEVITANSCLPGAVYRGLIGEAGAPRCYVELATPTTSTPAAFTTMRIQRCEAGIYEPCYVFTKTYIDGVGQCPPYGTDGWGIDLYEAPAPPSGRSLRVYCD